MTEAVIVATARSPIGRAFKGSLTTIRPDDAGPPDGGRGPGQGPPARPRRHRRPHARLRAPRWRAGLQHGPRGGRPARLRPPARHHGQPVLLVFAADHPDGVPRHQGRRGRCVHLGRRGVREPVRQGQQRQLAGHAEPAVRRARRSAPRPGPGRAHRTGTTRARTARCRTSTSPWGRPRRTWPSCGASPGRRRTSSACGRRTWPRRRSPTGSGSATSPRSRCPTARSSPPTTARGPAPHWRRWPGSSRCSARTARSPRATAARSTTAPRPSWS